MNLNVHPNVQRALRKARLSSEDVVCRSVSDLQRTLSISKGQATALLDEAATFVAPKPITVSELWRQQEQAADPDESSSAYALRRLSFGCQHLDELFEGGIPSRTITEIVGESRAGKTQFLLQLALTAQFSKEHGGLGGSVVYVCTEDAFPNKRLAQLIACARVRWPHAADRNFTDKILIKHIDSIDTQWRLVTHDLPTVMKLQNVRLVVIDSIAPLFRSEYTNTEFRERSRMIWSVGHALKQLAETFNVPIVCSNQVSAAIGVEVRQPTLPRNGAHPTVPPALVKPALGHAWGACVTTRLMLSRTEVYVYGSGGDGEAHVEGQDNAVATVRTAHLHFSPHLASRAVGYTVTQDGVYGKPL